MGRLESVCLKMNIPPAEQPLIIAGSSRGSFQFREAEFIALFSVCSTTVSFRNAADGDKSCIYKKQYNIFQIILC
jgi:hypothetical protein